MNICDWYLFNGVCNVISFQRFIRPRVLGEPCDEAAVASAMPQARAVFKDCRGCSVADHILPGRA
jgi:glutathione S-transferase